MDVFSTSAAALGVADLCGKIIKRCHVVWKGAKTIENEITELIEELTGVESLLKSVAETANASANLSLGSKEKADRVCKRMLPIIKHYVSLMERLNAIVLRVSGVKGGNTSTLQSSTASPIGVQPGNRIDRILKAWKKEKQGGALTDVRIRIVQHQNILQVHLTALVLIHSQDNVSSISRTQADMRICLGLRNQITGVLSDPLTKDLYIRDPIPEDIFNKVKTNFHFHIPAAVVPFFKGQRKLLDELKTEFTKPPGIVQKRFVIYGLAGSGKTQFCCKFAQDLRALFWGVFTVDASSQANAESSLCEIARQASVAVTVESAKHFLTNVGLPWLLIIDNADDQCLQIEKFFPYGEGGCILITTRDHDKRFHGTVGSKSHSFERLSDSEAEELLLETADEHKPYEEQTTKAAKQISKELHCLPLALVLAGKTIRSHVSSWVDYLNSYKRNRRNLAEYLTRKRKSFSQDERQACVYVSFEPLVARLQASREEAETDAFELMQFFAFLHHRNIRRDILIKAVKNPRIQQIETEQGELEVPVQLASRLMGRLTQQITRLVESLLSNQRYSWLFMKQTSILPAILREDALLDNEVDPDRLNRAFFQLQKYSFITPGEEIDTFTVHPLIHEWMRVRLGSLGSEAIWCEAAANVLGRCIVVDATVLAAEGMATRTSQHFVSKELLPHIQHVLQCQNLLRVRYQEAAQRSRRPLFYIASANGLSTSWDAIRLAKFSIVYFQCGDWINALHLQKQVQAYVLRWRGKDHPNTHRISQALAATYNHLDMHEEAVQLLRELVASSTRMYGKDHPITWKNVDNLAQLLLFGSMLTESRELHKRAWEGLKAAKTCGPNHKDTLLALRHLGAAESRFFRWEESARLCEEALTGLLTYHPDAEDEILFTKEDIALALAGAKQNIDRARSLMVNVLNKRKQIFGDEHPYTLFAQLNFARVECSIGEYHAAEERLARLLPIGRRSVGRTHNAVVLAECFLARCLASQRRFVEAEDTFKKVFEEHMEAGRQKGAKDHVHRILALWFLVQCREESGKLQDAKATAEDLLDSLVRIGVARYGLKHPLYDLVIQKLTTLESKISPRTTSSVAAIAPP